MDYRVRVIGSQSEGAEVEVFYISNSMQDWLTSCRVDAAVYYNLESARCAINQGIESIKQELDLYCHCKLEEIQIIGEVTTVNVIQTLKPSDI